MSTQTKSPVTRSKPEPYKPQVVCPECSGSGSIDDNEDENGEVPAQQECPECAGKGEVDKAYKVVSFPKADKMPKSCVVRDKHSGTVTRCEFVKNDCVPVNRYCMLDQESQPYMAYFTVVKYYEMLKYID